jgi:N,N'-diacetylchitobiose non-reducing end deacetylase
MPKTILIFVPHPDDADIYAGGLLAQRTAAGDRVWIVIATDGSKGSFDHDSATLARIRREEAAAAAAALGAEPPVLLNHPDMELDTLGGGQLRGEFIRLIRRYRPDVVIAEDPYARDVHPDHRAVAWAAFEAVTYAPLPLAYPSHLAAGLAPHFVVERYFYATEDIGSPNRFIDISETLPTKVAACVAHQSQAQFMMASIVQQAQLAGLDLAAGLGPLAADPQAGLAWWIEQQAAALGQAAAVAGAGEMRYAEAFRYERFDPLIEGLLAGSDQEATA